MKRGMTRTWWAAGVAVLVGSAWLGSCASRPESALPTVTSESPLPFAPVRLSVHPLTHLDVDPDNVVRLICHVELKDRWGDTTKARGTLRLELYRPADSTRPDLSTQELAWDVDLRDMDLNAAVFDPATRTYRLQLGGLPAWTEAMARRRVSGDDRARERLVIRASLATQGPDARPTVLRDEFQIEN